MRTPPPQRKSWAVDAMSPVLSDRFIPSSALDLGHKLEARPRLPGLELDLDVGELPGPAGLLLVGVLDGRWLGDALPVVHLRGAHVALDVELALQAVHEYLQVELAHALDDRLVRLLVARVVEGGVLGGELLQAGAHLLQVALGL